MKLMKSWKVVTGQRLSCPIMNTTRLVEEKFCWHEICPKIDSWIFLDVVRIHNFHNSEMKIKTHRFLLPLLFSKTEHSQIHSIQYIQYILTWSSKSMMMGEGGAETRAGWKGGLWGYHQFTWLWMFKPKEAVQKRLPPKCTSPKLGLG